MSGALYIIMYKKLVDTLISKKYKICCAESCTGGLLSSGIVSVSGSSAVMDMGFVTYANSAKISLLGVDENTVKEYGVVSEPVVKQMAEGACNVSGANVGVGISGIAGPTGATPSKPVGTVCFGFCINGKTTYTTKHFEGLDRQGVRNAACEFAVNELLNLLNY